MLWFIIASLAIVFMMVHGIEYVSWPRLIPPTDIIHYEGPGFRSAHNGKGFTGPLAQKLDLSGQADGLGARLLFNGRKRALTVNGMEEGTKKRVD
jgi:hypothetical protein